MAIAQHEERVAYAAIDLGTSQVKLGVYCPQLSTKIVVLDSLNNEVFYGSSGEAQVSYALTHEKSHVLLKQLEAFVRSEQITSLSVGICGHVSSLLEWNKIRAMPVNDHFPIWLDATCSDSLAEYEAVMGNNKSKSIIGTFLPTGTNWLFTKLLNRRKLSVPDGSIFLQLGDALFFDLTGFYETHFSSQISMVNLQRRQYAPELLSTLGLTNSILPTISYDGRQPNSSILSQVKLPVSTIVFPAMADLYTALYGLRLKDRQGFMLANTSEQAGAFYDHQPKALDNFLSISFDAGFVNYGSTNTGGNLVNWYVSQVLQKPVDALLLKELTQAAQNISPDSTPIILPYLQGERAPLWDSQITASILELRSAHSNAHLFRAILESIAFARRQCFEEIGIDGLETIKIGGGSSKNELWNSIRASVLNKTVAIADEKELSMAGVIDYMMQYQKSPFEKPEINFSTILPNQRWKDTYDEKYARFIKYQKLLS